jgi:16S rRNA (guanine(966)-N(2))-methyltransferase RsmD
MRIIGGKLKGIHLNAPASLPVRPTKDMAKEALFNILYNTYDFEDCDVLDLFSGTGSVSLEFASRGIKSVVAVDKHAGCVRWLEDVIKKFNITEIRTIKADAFKFLDGHKGKYRIIFADPPYDLPNIPNISELVFANDLLTDNGVLIVEHPPFLKLDAQGNFVETRRYGNSSFSFFEKPEITS